MIPGHMTKEGRRRGVEGGAKGGGGKKTSFKINLVKKIKKKQKT